MLTIRYTQQPYWFTSLYYLTVKLTFLKHHSDYISFSLKLSEERVQTHEIIYRQLYILHS